LPDWLLQLLGPMAGGAVTGVMLLAGLRVEVKNLKEHIGGVASSVRRAHARLDKHLEDCHVRRTDHA